MKEILITQVLEDFPELEVLTNTNYDDKVITIPEISRPGVELAGFLEHFSYLRVQMFGLQENNFLESINFNETYLDSFMHPEIPLIIFCRGIVPNQKFIDMANEKGLVVCTTKRLTSKFYATLFNYLEEVLAPEIRMHGVLVSIYGHGVIIKGKSGIGKSEVALDLINRGHILVADDSVVIRQIDDALIGSAPALLRSRLEIRGIGIVDVQKIFGVTKVIQSKKIDLVIEITKMTGEEDRIGTAEHKERIIDVDVPKVFLPVSEGRALSSIIEVAVANYELKSQHNYDSSKAFIEDLNKLLLEGRDNG